MTELKLAEINQDALRVALNWALDEIDVLSNKLVQFGYPQGILMLDREDQADGYWNACNARRALDEWRCPKCGVQADERWNCCEVHPEAALPQEGAAVAPVAWRARWAEHNGAWSYWPGRPDCGPETVVEPLYAAPSPAAGVDAVQVAVLAEREAIKTIIRDMRDADPRDADFDYETADTILAAIRERPLPCP